MKRVKAIAAVARRALVLLGMAAMVWGGVCGCSTGHEIEDEVVPEDELKKIGSTVKYLFGASHIVEKEDETTIVVEAANDYDDAAGYGFEFTSANGGTVNASNISSDASFQFKVKVDNGNYVVTVVTSTTEVLSEKLPDSFDYRIDKSGNTESIALDLTRTPTGITKKVTANKESTFDVAVVDGVLNLKFLLNTASTVSVSSVAYTPFSYEKREKPYLFAIGDSTTALDNYEKTNNHLSKNKWYFSWGPAIEHGEFILPSELGGFVNCGCSGADTVTAYNDGYLEKALLNVHPGDYVTVNMGINQGKDFTLDGITVPKAVSGNMAGDDSRRLGQPMLSRYYVEGIIQRGGIPVIATITAEGPWHNTEAYNSSASTNNGFYYDVATKVVSVTTAGGKRYNSGEIIPANTWNNSRMSNAYNKVLLTIAENYDLDIIALGCYVEEKLSSLTNDDVKTFNTDYGTNYKTVFEMVQQAYYNDQHHYYKPVALLHAQYVTDCIVKIMNDNYTYAYSEYIY